jgi:hypothetical protein
MGTSQAGRSAVEGTSVGVLTGGLKAGKASSNVAWVGLAEFVEQASGLWRSLVAHLTGGQGVASSNLASPTRQMG